LDLPYNGLPKETVVAAYNFAIKAKKENHLGQTKIRKLIEDKLKAKFAEATIAGWLYLGNAPFKQEETQFKPKKIPIRRKLEDAYARKKLSISETGKIFGVEFGTVKNWLKLYNIPLRNHLESMNTKIIKSMLREQKLIKPTKNYKGMSKEKAYVLGVLCGDGYISKKVAKLEIRKDEEFIKRFVKSIRKIYGLNYSYRYYPKRNSFICDVSNQLICKDLMKYGQFGCYNWKTPDKILNSKNDWIVINFLQGLFDSEGRVGDYSVSFSSINNRGLEQVKLLLERLGIKSRAHYKHHITVITRKENLKKFRDTIGFTIERKKNKLNSFYKGNF